MTAIDKIYEQVMNIPDESKAILAERIVEYLAVHVNPDLERLHLDIVKNRKREIHENAVKPIEGEKALAQAHRLVNPSPPAIQFPHGIR